MPDNANQETLANPVAVPSALTEAQADALRDSLNADSMMPVRANFDAAVLGKLYSGADFQPWHKQARTRLLWMALPMLCSFLVATLYLERFAEDLPAPQIPGTTTEPVTQNQVASALPPQSLPLPPVPTVLIHQYRMPNIVVPDWTRRDYPVLDKVHSFPPAGEAAGDGTNHTAINGRARQ